MSAEFTNRLEHALTTEPIWYLPILQDIVSALQKLVGDRFKVYTEPDQDGATVFIDMGPEQPKHKALRLTCGPSYATFVGFRGSSVNVLLQDGQPEDPEAVESAVLEVLTDISTLVQVCRSLA